MRACGDGIKAQKDTGREGGREKRGGGGGAGGGGRGEEGYKGRSIVMKQCTLLETCYNNTGGSALCCALKSALSLSSYTEPVCKNEHGGHVVLFLYSVLLFDFIFYLNVFITFLLLLILCWEGICFRVILVCCLKVLKSHLPFSKIKD